jgi:ADP-heptose:LPS heptosyltransferase
VLTTPVVRCIKRQHPDIEIHYLTKNSFRSILENNPYLAKVHTINKDIDEVVDVLKEEKFDMIIDLHNNLRTTHLKLKLRRPSSSFKKLNLRKWLLVRFKIDTMPNAHVVDRYMQAASVLDISNDNQGLDYFIPSHEEVDLQTLPETHRKGYEGFVIGAKHYTKQLPPEKLIAVCMKIDAPIILLGGKEDVERGEMIAKALGTKIYNACGKYNLNQSASLVRQAERIVSHDTGLMHIAAAFKKDIISVWGNTVPAFGFTPYLPGKDSMIVEVKGLPCRPCSKIGYAECPQGHFKCMRDINETIFEKIKLQKS